MSLAWVDRLNPEWNETYKLSGVLDDFLQSGLKLRVMDKDLFSKDDLLGHVIVDLTEVQNFSHLRTPAHTFAHLRTPSHTCSHLLPCPRRPGAKLKGA